MAGEIKKLNENRKPESKQHILKAGKSLDCSSSSPITHPAQEYAPNTNSAKMSPNSRIYRECMHGLSNSVPRTKPIVLN